MSYLGYSQTQKKCGNLGTRQLLSLILAGSFMQYFPFLALELIMYLVSACLTEELLKDIVTDKLCQHAVNFTQFLICLKESCLLVPKLFIDILHMPVNGKNFCRQLSLDKQISTCIPTGQEVLVSAWAFICLK